MNSNIQMSHLPEVDEIDRAKIDAILSGAYAKLERILNNKLLLRAHFKDEQSAGARRKHFVQMHLSAPGLELASSGSDWNLITALQKAVEAIEKETVKAVKS